MEERPNWAYGRRLECPLWQTLAVQLLNLSQNFRHVSPLYLLVLGFNGAPSVFRMREPAERTRPLTDVLLF